MNLLNWRIALPAVGGFAVILVVWQLFPPGPVIRSPASFSATVSTKTTLDSNLKPTVANYQMVASQSFEKLDELLNEQGRRRLPPVPVYTASTFRIASKSD